MPSPLRSSCASPAEKLAEMRQALGEAELLLFALRRGQVGEENEEAEQLTARASQRRHRETDAARLAAGEHFALLPLRRLAARHRRAQHGEQRRLAGEQLAERRARRRRRAEQRGARWIERQDAGLAVEQQEPAFEARPQRALERSEVAFLAGSRLAAVRRQRALDGGEQERALVVDRRRVELRARAAGAPRRGVAADG